MNLSLHFTLEEFVQSQTATRHHLPNDPTAGNIQNMKLLCSNVLEPLRTLIACPITISSGYRSPAVNQLVGGSLTSQHCEGKAADLLCPPLGSLGLFKAIIRSRLAFDQLIYEGSWVHVSYNADAANRGQILQADFSSPPVKYIHLTEVQALHLQK